MNTIHLTILMKQFINRQKSFFIKLYFDTAFKDTCFTDLFYLIFKDTFDAKCENDPKCPYFVMYVVN